MQSSTLILGIIVGAALAIFAVFSLVTSTEHLKDCLADPEFDLAEEYIITYRMVRVLLLAMAVAVIVLCVKNL